MGIVTLFQPAWNFLIDFEIEVVKIVSRVIFLTGEGRDYPVRQVSRYQHGTGHQTIEPGHESISQVIEIVVSPYGWIVSP